MSKILYNFFKKKSFLLFLSISLSADNYDTNSFNNHGVVGLINSPTARFYDEGVHGVTLYDGTPDQKITLSSSPYDWMEASFFYTNIQGMPYPGYEYQDYKDKGFNIKLRLKKEGILPAIAIGLNDFAGTGFHSSEYIVASYGINKLDMHFGLGWGQLDGANNQINNPLGYLDERFKNRPKGFTDEGGQFNPDKYFSSLTASPFYGMSYSLKNNLLLKIELDPTNTTGGQIKYDKKESDFSYGLDYSINDSFTIGASFERGNYLSLRFVYRNNPKRSIKKYEYIDPDNIGVDDNKYTKLIKNLEENGIGVNKISESSRSIGLELTQFIHPDLKVVEQIIAEASKKAGIKKNIKKDIKIAELKAVSELDDVFARNAQTIYERNTKRRINTNNSIRFKPFIASREEFFKGALLAENDTELVLNQNLFFNVNLKYSLANNFEDLRFPPFDTFPAQVRSDIKQYLKNMDKGVLIGRAQFDYHLTPKDNHHLMFTGGILEDMFSGIGMEYLFFKQNTNYSFGVELFKVRKRDYDWGFGHLDYENTTLTANLYLRNYGLIPFDMKISAGEYLAGDVGATFEISRKFANGVNFGAFASVTDVTAEQFGEGSFDKGIFFNIPIFGNSISYTWRPLTKDPAQKLVRRNALHDLLVRFRPID
ncbi:MAG: hypothetical protein CMF96_08285 [Candidatus Marinimicrobia bacterium]|nr:hypothetical protein [Candidatus Neomarinimicrobiota bacterium]